MAFKTVGVKEKDKERLKSLSKKLNLKDYEVISKLLDYYERLEMLQHYLGCESIEQVFEVIEEMLPKDRKKLIIAETNKYIDKLRRLEVPEYILNKLADTIYPIILNGGRR